MSAFQQVDTCAYPTGNEAGGDYGQNLGHSETVNEACDLVTEWYNQISNYNNETNSCETDGACDGYTQVMWPDTVRIGCSSKYCETLTVDGGTVTGKTFIACHYLPRPEAEDGLAIYKTGPQCSECPQERPWCTDGLCTGDSEEEDAVCMLDCNGHGDLDTFNCACVCHTNWTGEFCASESSRRLLDIEEGDILQCANQYRSMQPASNMIELIWDEGLAETANAWGDQCEWKPLSMSESYGQTLAYRNAEKMGHMCDYVEHWHSEIQYFNNNTLLCMEGYNCDHYTQVVWAVTSRIGCGMRKCEPLIMPEDGAADDKPLAWFLVCLYEKKGNYEGASPYKAGDKCSMCPKAQPWCRDGLCTDKTHVDGVATECRSVCLNGGSIDLNTCLCSYCPAGWRGDHCELPCEDRYDCSGFADSQCSKNWFKNNCALRCGYCTPAANSNPIRRSVSDSAESIIAVHNEMRRARNATNMRELVWDDTLAELATSGAEECTYDEELGESAPGNAGVNMDQRDVVNSVENFTRSILRGWEEDFNAGYNTETGECSNEDEEQCAKFLRVVSDSNNLGCDIKFCSTLSSDDEELDSSNTNFLVCLYSNDIDGMGLPYTTGTACSECPSDARWCREGLCTAQQAEADNGIECLRMCQNGGTLNSSSCSCNCPAGWTGDLCEVETLGEAEDRKRRASCSQGQFACESNECIPDAWNCDSWHDCRDASDEQEGCQCEGFRCKTGGCIPEEWRCDGLADCSDHSDEGSSCNCTEDQFQCEAGGCLPSYWYCDGIEDCPDKTDEPLDCVCTDNQFTCIDGECVERSDVCNLHKDCSNGEDEFNCLWDVMNLEIEPQPEP